MFGKPWKIVGKFDSYDRANEKRKELIKDKTLQVKVKKYGPGGKIFVVKTRVVEEEFLDEIKEKKIKSRKKRRTHKRDYKKEFSKGAVD